MSCAEIIRRIPRKARFFCTIDAINGYFQIKLSSKSSKLTTFLLPWGKFRHCRCPQGCASSGDEWNIRSDAIIQGLLWCIKIIDDILIWAETLEELMERIRIVLNRCKELKITMSREKLHIGRKVKFAGYMVSSTGFEPAPDQVKAIADLPAPTSLPKLRSFLGMANQLGSFIPDLSQATSGMRQLLKKNVANVADHQLEFEKAKKILTSPLIVHPFDPNLPTQLVTDASRLHGMGYILLQVEKKKTEKFPISQE